MQIEYSYTLAELVLAMVVIVLC